MGAARGASDGEGRLSLPLIAAGDGCRIAARLDGEAGRPVVVLSSSLGADHTMWAPQVEALVSRFRVLRYDPRGHGASDVPAAEASIERLARDVLDLLDAHGVERACFVGLSMGGMVGQWLGAHAAARIDHLVLANTAWTMGPPSGWVERIRDVRAGGMGAIVDSVVARWFTHGFRERSPEAVERVRQTFLATSPLGYAACCAAIRDMDQRASAASIAPPTLLIAGAEDPSTPPDRAAEIAAAIERGGGDVRLVTLDAAHLSNVEQAAGFSAALLDFLPRARP
jgi:3-oxoadipate enol-lactonase